MSTNLIQIQNCSKDTKLLDRIADDTLYYYFAEIPKDTRFWLTRPDTHIHPYSGKGRRPT